jgi:hypothetical protein
MKNKYIGMKKRKRKAWGLEEKMIWKKRKKSSWSKQREGLR